MPYQGHEASLVHGKAIAVVVDWGDFTPQMLLSLRTGGSRLPVGCTRVGKCQWKD